MTSKDYFVQVLMLVSWTTTTWVYSAPRQPRLSLAEPMPSYFYSNINGHPGTYAFGYDVSDGATGNVQYRNEERYPNGTVVGSYGYLDAAGRPQRYRYIADERGYRVMRDRLRPSPTINPNAIFNVPEEVTWKRKKPNRVIKSEVRYNKIMSLPGKYVLAN